MGRGWSIAYRTLDAQYWGVPQRRRRIYLVADFTGECAGEILFKREGLRGHLEESGAKRKGIAEYAQKGLATDDRYGSSPRSTSESGIASTLCTSYGTKWNGNAGAYNGENFVLEPDVVAFTQNQRDEVRILGSKTGALQAQPGMKQQTFIIGNLGGQAQYGKASLVNGTLRAGAQGAVAYSIENHPNDSRVNIDESGKMQTLTSRMGTGGGNVPRVMEPKPVYCLQGNGIDRADTAGCNGKGWRENESYTLNTIDRPAVVYAMDRASFNQGQNAKYDFEVSDDGVNSTLLARGSSAVLYAIDQGGGKSSANITEDTSPMLTCTHGGAPAICHEDATEEKGTYTASKAFFFTRGAYERADCLVATDYKDPPIINAKEGAHYTVRRLTPTECARLQGFPDRWGDIEEKKNFTEDEYRFWLEARNTHATINGRKVRDYTQKQMLAWYNKLHTDSAEYKMWGNGIALPTALYCMQGIADALNGGETKQ